MAREKEIQGTIIRKAEACGAYVINEYQDGRRRKGIPDLTLCYQGQYVAVEVKQPGGRIRAEQLIELRKVRLAGGVGIIAYDWSDVEFAFNSIEAGWRGEQLQKMLPDLPAVPTVRLEDDQWGSV